MAASTRDAFGPFAERAGGDDVFRVRLARHFADFYEPFARLYGADPRFADGLDAVADAMAEAYATREPRLRRLDYEREITPDWFQRQSQAGYIAYTDRFAGTLDGVLARLPYVRELGLSYLHLMPLLRSRPGENDGGYAVAGYRDVEPALGTMDDLRALSGTLHDEGMSLCVDLVINHTAREHDWAQRAIAGDAAFRDFYLTYPDRTEPDAFERTLPLVFPDFKPSNFTWSEELGRWVWTTFNTWQWDLDYANPAVFAAMLENLLFLANAGVDVLRLDAVPFMWKRLGTSCQNQPEVHELLQAYRAIVRAVAPAVAFKAEAIVSPHDLVGYLGLGRHAGRECDLAYHNSLMVLLWSTLATRRVDLMTRTLRAMPVAPAGSTWITYVRCHDDIGWAITEDNAAAAGEDAHEHRKFLVRYFQGDYWESFARGAVFQPEFNGEGRTSGTAASLAGLEAALEAGDDGRRPRRTPDPAPVRRGLLLRRDPARLHGRRAGAAQRPRAPRRSRAGGRQPLAAPPVDGLEGGRAAPRRGNDRGAAVRGAAADGGGAARLRRAPRRGDGRAVRHRQPARLRLPARPPGDGVPRARELLRARAARRRRTAWAADRRRAADLGRSPAPAGGRPRDPRAIRLRLARVLGASRAGDRPGARGPRRRWP